MNGAKKRYGNWILLRDGLLSTLLSLTVCYFLSLLFFNISFFNPISKALQDFSFLDIYYAERLNKTEQLSPNIVLINVEHKSRREIALALQQVTLSKPKVVGFDVVLKEFKGTRGDSLLARYLNHEKVITSVIILSDTVISNHPFFGSTNKTGFVNFNFDTQSAVIREFSSEYQNSSGDNYQSFSTVISKEYLSNADWERKTPTKRLHEDRVINYQGNLDRFINFTIDEFMALENKEVIEDKIVLLGYLGSPTGNIFDVEDKHFTPLNPVTSGKSVPDMYGVVIHANIIDMILADKFLFKVSKFWLVVLAFFFSLVASTYFIWLDQRLKISYRTVRKAVLFVFTVLMVWITLGLFKYGVVLKTAPIIAVTAFSAGFIKFYKHLVRYVNTKWNFRSYYQ